MNSTKSLLKWPPFPSLALVIVFTVLSSMMSSYFLSESYLSGFIGSYAPLIILAVGQGVVMIGGGIDISLGAVMTLVNVLVVNLVGMNVNPLTAFLVAGLAGAAFGLMNGLVISLLRVNALLVTLATSTMAAGAALAIQPVPGGTVPTGFVTWYQETVAGIPTPIFFILGLLLLWTVIYFSPLGTQLYATGENIKKAFVSGVRVSTVRTLSYTFGGLAAGLAGIAVSGLTGTGDNSVGLTDTLMSVAACIIGGIALSGGIGRIIGTVFGALFLGLVFNLVLSSNVSPFYQSLLSGGIILVSIVLASVARRQGRAGLD